MEIFGYIGFVALIFLGVTWTIGVRVKLGIGVHTILVALFFLVSAIVLAVSGANKLHSFWIIPVGYLLPMFVVFSAVHAPSFFAVFRLIASSFAAIVRVGIPKERIEAAMQADLQATFERWSRKHDAKR